MSNTPATRCPAVRPFRAGAAVYAALMLIVLVGCSDPPAPEVHLPASTIARHNQAIGLMEQFRYEEAAELMGQLVAEHPDWLDGRVDYAITLLNRREPIDALFVREELDSVLREDPENLRARYCMGLLQLDAEEFEDAEANLRMVAEADPSDGYAAFFLGEAVGNLGRHDERIEWFGRATERDPYITNAYFRRHNSMRAAGQDEAAEAVFDVYKKMINHPRARTAEFKYTRMGPKAELKPIDVAEATEPAPPAGPLFANAAPLPIDGSISVDSASSVTVVDLNGDGRLEVFISNTGNVTTPNILLMAKADGSGYVVDRDHPLAAVPYINAALWGDFDNDGLVDAFLCRAGPNQLWRQTERGVWVDVTDAIGVEQTMTSTFDGAFVDADHDGDLDLFLVNADGPNELLNNNFDGTFRRIGERTTLAGDGSGSSAVVFADLDADRDADVIVLDMDGSPAVYANELLWEYRRAEGFDAFEAEKAIAAIAAADLDVDGYPELYCLTDTSVDQWSRDAAGNWQRRQIASRDSGITTDHIAATDLDGDGMADLLFSDGASWAALLDPIGTPKRVAAGADASVAWTAALLDAAKGPAVIGLDAGRSPVVWQPGPGRYPFAAVRFTGMYRQVEPPKNEPDTSAGDEDQTWVFDSPAAATEQLRSNASGIGVNAVARVGDRWTAVNTYRWQSGPGQSLQPVAIGLGGRDEIDFMRVNWPDGVMQTALSLKANELHELQIQVLHEQRRVIESCPLVFAWDGERFAFVTDFLGVGGIGFNVGAGEYVPPRPWENLILPAGLPKPRDGRYVLKLHEPMEETTYFDSASLVAYDLPPGWDMTLDERFHVNAPEPTGRPIFFRDELHPASAVNDRGEDVTAAVAKADLVAAQPGRLDRRFIGRTEPHAVTLRFDRALRDWIDGAGGELVLVADGWVEYPYSQTMFAAWQAGATYDAASLDARGPDGRWHTVIEQFGYPAGMPRQMALPIPIDSIPAGATELRIRCGIEVYWDRLRLVRAEPCEQATRTVLPIAEACVAHTGFPRRTTSAQRAPHYEYADRVPFDDMRYQVGAFTAFGPVEPLVTARDSAVAICGPGEELHIEFEVGDAAPPVGWTRRLVLETTGWCKGMDLYTRDNETLGPLPEHDDITPDQRDRRDELHRRFNTRYTGGPS